MKHSIILVGLVFLANNVFAASEGKSLKQTATRDAIEAGMGVWQKYLNCLVQDTDERALCEQQIIKTDKVFAKKYKHNQQYQNIFRSKAIKLGFQYLINKQHERCEYVYEAPVFDRKTLSYQVQCQAPTTYYFRYNYGLNKWQLLPSKP